jgi:hypothetical protein
VSSEGISKYRTKYRSNRFAVFLSAYAAKNWSMKKFFRKIFLQI